MDRYKKILVATDFSETAEHAIAWAIDLATHFDAAVTLLHACWLPPMAYAAFAEGILYPTEDMMSGAAARLAAVLTEAQVRYSRVESALVFEEPRTAILRVATDRAADVIVLGTHGRSGLSRFLIGSVAESVVRLARVPVLTVSATASS
jgi:nucleotide-binding universal stress UspA family protein